MHLILNYMLGHIESQGRIVYRDSRAQYDVI